jgi:hypothetical protein
LPFWHLEPRFSNPSFNYFWDILYFPSFFDLERGMLIINTTGEVLIM